MTKQEKLKFFDKNTGYGYIKTDALAKADHMPLSVN